ncbi:MAG: hypothetical protein HYX61_07065 [Gammaproteobacteria bacterium]|jgi:hypothetical protein|nr:hypothetical protein [Gammaproteobacteria bacterium]
MPKRKDDTPTPENKINTNENEKNNDERKKFLISHVLGISRGMKGYGIKPAAAPEPDHTNTKKPKPD